MRKILFCTAILFSYFLAAQELPSALANKSFAIKAFSEKNKQERYQELLAFEAYGLSADDAKFLVFDSPYISGILGKLSKKEPVTYGALFTNIMRLIQDDKYLLLKDMKLLEQKLAASPGTYEAWMQHRTILEKYPALKAELKAMDQFIKTHENPEIKLLELFQSYKK